MCKACLSSEHPGQCAWLRLSLLLLGPALVASPQHAVGRSSQVLFSSVRHLSVSQRSVEPLFGDVYIIIKILHSERGMMDNMNVGPLLTVSGDADVHFLYCVRVETFLSNGVDNTMLEFRKMQHAFPLTALRDSLLEHVTYFLHQMFLVTAFHHSVQVCFIKTSEVV